MPPAARMTDMHTCPMVTGVVPHVGGPILPPCCPQVLINALPAARITDMATCVGPPDSIMIGSPTVYIGGLMAARLGDPTVHGGVIVVGSPNVLIGGPVAATNAVGGVITVTWNAMTISGSSTDVQAFLQLIALESSRSDTMRNLLATVTTDTLNSTTFTLVRNDPSVWVDAYLGGGNQTINMDYFDGGEFPDSPSATHPDATTRGENLIHGMDEAHQGAMLQNMNGNDPSGSNWYNASHQHAINTENSYRKDRGQTTQLISSDAGPGPNDATFKYNNGAYEVHDQQTHGVTHHDSSGKVIP